MQTIHSQKQILTLIFYSSFSSRSPMAPYTDILPDLQKVNKQKHKDADIVSDLLKVNISVSFVTVLELQFSGWGHLQCPINNNIHCKAGRRTCGSSALVPAARLSPDSA